MKGLFTVARFTIRDMVKRKSFIISNIIIMLIIVIGFNVPNIINSFSEDNIEEGTKLLIVDQSNIFEGTLENINNLELGYKAEIKNEEITFDQIKEKIENEEIDEALIIRAKEGKIHMEYIVDNLLYVEEMPEKLVSAVSAMYSNVQLSKLNLTPEEIASISPNFEFELKQTEEKEVEGNPVVMMLLSLVLFFAIYFYAYQVSSSITTEKTSKIIETLVTSTKPSTIVIGKTLGIGAVGLVQVVVMIILAVICNSLFLEEGMLSSIISLENMTPFLLVIALLYFILGYFTYALFYALTGSTVSKPEDIQSANGPVAMLAMIGFYLAYFTMMDPSSSLNQFAGLFPLSSPFCMPLRVMMGLASTGEVLLSIGILLLTIFVIAKVSIKIYSNAILNYGKSGLKDILRMYKDKNN